MTERKVADPKQISAFDSKYSVQALSLLAEVSSPTQCHVLDLCRIPYDSTSFYLENVSISSTNDALESLCPSVLTVY